MRSGIERILTDSRPLGSHHRLFPVEISGFSHFFGFEPCGQRGLLPEYLENPKIGMWAWHLPKVRRTRPLLSRSFLGILSVLPIKREFFHRRGQHLCRYKKGKQKMKNVFKFIVLSALLMS